MANVGTLVARVEADVAPYIRNMGLAERRTQRFETVAKRSLKSVGNALGRVTKSIFSFRGAMVAAAGAGGIAFFIKAASDVEESVSKFNVVFADGAKAAEEWAERQSKAVNRSKFELIDYLATFQDTFVPLGFARDEAAQLSRELVTLSLDLASFNNAMEPDVVRNLTSALVGNHEAVRSYGSIITEARLKTFLLSSGMVDNVEKATNLQKLIARLKIIFADTTDAQGDAIKTASSFANEWKGLKGRMNDVAVEIGQELLPAATNLVRQLSIMTPQIGELGREFAAGLPALLEWVAAFGRWTGILSETPDQRIAAITEELSRAHAFMQKLQNDKWPDWLQWAEMNAAQERVKALREELERLRAATFDTGMPFVGGTTVPGAPAGKTDLDALGKKKVTTRAPFGFNVEDFIPDVKPYEEALARRNKLLEEGKALFEETRTPLEKFIARQEQLNILLREGAIDTETHSRALQQASDQYGTLTDKANEFGEDAATVFVNVASKMSDAIARGEDFKSVLRGLIADVQDFALAWLKANAFKSSSSFGGSSILDGILNLGKSSLGPQFSSAGLNPIEALQSAGSFQHGASFKVAGRGGTDANFVGMNVSKGEQVDVTPRGGRKGSGGFNVFIDATGADAAKVAQLEQIVRQLHGSFEKRVIGTVHQAVSRDPRMRSRNI